MKHATLFAVVMFAACGSVEPTTPAGPDPTDPADLPVVTAALDDLPVTCADALKQTPHGADGEYILYADGDAEKPWSAWCANMGTGSPSEYLTLVNTGSNYNYGQYSTGGLISSGTTVTTYYTKVRIDPMSFVVDIGDQTFATSTGSLVHPDANGGITVTSMPLGVAMGCGQFGTSDIDLGGTMFAIDDTYALAGSSADGVTAFTPDQRGVAASGMGWCGWNGPKDAPFNPMGHMSAWALQLKYAP